MSDSAQEVDPMPMAGAKRKLSSVLDVVSDLERRLPLAKSDNIVAAALADTVRRQITQKRTDHLEDDAAAYSAAVTLWNLVLRLERDLEQMHAPVPADDESATRQKTKFEQLKIDYTIVQLLQLSREGRLDDADQLYKDAEMDSAKITFGSVATEKLTEALFQIGKDLLLNKDFIPATLWLDRSYECVSKADLTTLCTEVKELRLTIIHSLAIASLGVRTSSGNQKAQELVQTLQSDKTEKDSRRIHLVQEDAIEYVEKLIITRVWLLAHQRETQEELDVVQNVLEKLRVPISADTASAAQTV
ncbi:Transcription factor [Sporothrix epigloea]|uniref:Transcription factor n=1 Tax=Sporothrix epigloea TaxID=1892477 RepID=A0ABP0DCM7_9PEZI